jgi:hypothetical protein
MPRRVSNLYLGAKSLLSASQTGRFFEISLNRETYPSEYLKASCSTVRGSVGVTRSPVFSSRFRRSRSYKTQRLPTHGNILMAGLIPKVMAQNVAFSAVVTLTHRSSRGPNNEVPFTFEPRIARHKGHRSLDGSLSSPRITNQSASDCLSELQFCPFLRRWLPGSACVCLCCTFRFVNGVKRRTGQCLNQVWIRNIVPHCPNSILCPI